MVTTMAASETAVRALLDEVVDPEIPVLTIADIGILRDVDIAANGTVRVSLTPTYSGCPAIGTIESDVRAVLAGAGFDRVDVAIVHQPTWTTDWMSDDARAKLEGFGIAPPGGTEDQRMVLCPQCASDATTTVSEFGSTACKALMVCSSCGEPFDHFKAI